MGVRTWGVLLLVLTFAMACSQDHCRRKVEAKGTAVPVDAGGDAASKPTLNERVLIYKYDGSLQCGMGKAIPLETMAKELSGIQIFSSVKKRDGLMHIQVCGSITGMANVFEIPTKNLKQAEAKGFKKWSFE